MKKVVVINKLGTDEKALQSAPPVTGIQTESHCTITKILKSIIHHSFPFPSFLSNNLETVNKEIDRVLVLLLWKISDPNPTLMEGCKLNPTLHLPTEQAATFMACKIYAVTALLMLPLFIQPKTRLVTTTTTTTTMLSSRKVNPQMGQLQKVGALVILNCRGKKELLVTRFILLKVNSKALLGRVLSGLKIDATELFMVGSVLLSN